MYIQELKRAAAAWKLAIDTEPTVMGNKSFNFDYRSSVCIGSGCSHVIASLCERMLSRRAGVTKFCTPYEFVHSGARPEVAFLISAKGNHLDSINCYRELRKRGGKLYIVTTLLSSPLVTCASNDMSGTVIIVPKVEFDVEGFIPVESTIVLAATVVRMSGLLGNQKDEALEVFEQAQADHENAKHLMPLLNDTDIFHLIPSFWGRPAAQDLESRLTESGMGIAVITDPWDLAHGRFMAIHNGHYKQVVIVINSADEEEKKESLRILSGMPNTIKTLHLSAPYSGLLGSIYCLVRTMFLISTLSKIKGVDPACPAIPLRGREMYMRRLVGSWK